MDEIESLLLEVGKAAVAAVDAKHAVEDIRMQAETLRSANWRTWQLYNEGRVPKSAALESQSKSAQAGCAVKEAFKNADLAAQHAKDLAEHAATLIRDKTGVSKTQD